MKIDVSVIVPIYNCEKYIERTINNLKRQNLHNIEFILINDGSVDKTDEIIKKNIENDSRFRYLYQKNTGVSSARNLGLKNCSGNYICFIDSDDVIEDNMFQELFSLVNENFDIAITSIKKRNISGNIITSSETLERTTFDNEKGLIEWFKKSFEPMTLAGKIFSKEIVKGLEFEDGRSSNEDKYFIFLTLLKAKKIIYYDKQLYTYEMHANSLSTKKIDDRIFDNIYFANLIDENIHSNYKLNSELINLSLMNKIESNLFVLRNFYRFNCNKEYKAELENIRMNLKRMKVLKSKCNVMKKIEYIIIEYFTYMYKYFIVVWDVISGYER